MSLTPYSINLSMHGTLNANASAMSVTCLGWSTASQPHNAGWLTVAATRQPVVFCVHIDALDTEPLGRWLTADELARSGRFHQVDDRRRFAVGRGVLRHLLGGHLGRPPLGLEFVLGPYGKPYLGGQGQADAPYFNVSHSGEWVLIALHARGEVGVDVEQIRRGGGGDWDLIAARVFSARELAVLRDSPASARDDTFFALWTRHEARLKALGEGLGMRDPGESTEATASTRTAEVAALQEVSLAVAPGYAAACAWRGEVSVGANRVGE